jgi:putative PIN family toxin of toxin-antitoxin system
MRIVFDTNVLFAAFVARTGLCAKIFEECLLAHEIFLSQFILSELRRILSEKSSLENNLIDSAIQSLVEASTDVQPMAVQPNVIRDANDAAILGTALAAKANLLISGDKDLLILKTFDEFEIISPREFHDRFLK